MTFRSSHPLTWVLGATVLSLLLYVVARSPLPLALRLALTVAPSLVLFWLGRYQRQPEGWARARQTLLLVSVFLADAIVQPAWYVSALAWGVAIGLTSFWNFTPSDVEARRST